MGTAVNRFREELALTLDLPNNTLAELLDLYQEALDEHREAALNDCAEGH